MKAGIVTEEFVRRVLRHKMSLLLRIRIHLHLRFSRKSTVARKRIVDELRRRKTLTVSREELDWFPSIDPGRCSGCGICRSFCSKDVFEMDTERSRAQVARPYQCVFLCTGCIPKCPEGAITFPDRAAFERFVVYR